MDLGPNKSANVRGAAKRSGRRCHLRAAAPELGSSPSVGRLVGLDLRGHLSQSAPRCACGLPAQHSAWLMLGPGGSSLGPAGSSLRLVPVHPSGPLCGAPASCNILIEIISNTSCSWRSFHMP